MICRPPLVSSLFAFVSSAAPRAARHPLHQLPRLAPRVAFHICARRFYPDSPTVENAPAEPPSEPSAEKPKKKRRHRKDKDPAAVADPPSDKTPPRTKRRDEPRSGRANPKTSAEDDHKPLSNKDRELWQVQKEALKRKFGDEGWNPRKRLSPDAMDGIRAMHAANPTTFTTAVLAEQFEVSPEVIRRILRSKWQPSEEEAEERRIRWEKRGAKIWTEKAKEGLKPPQKWRDMGIGKRGPPRKKRKPEPEWVPLREREPVVAKATVRVVQSTAFADRIQ
ncbi:hypothetical protein EJ06DRAFT_530216 [Trichodelitschia bisporula]|uniref:Required for respiratory growth protein 9, mitochondrial n=1 Tax=Trichodelitschia bisporula TaxID=703511 RepID=A0A6G1HW32_9PEZI|nr:hypothetical protein EJ06DRAFT_530216 [Trichodelitschia bisporula]